MKKSDIGEAVFDIGYLMFDLIAGIIFLAMSQGRGLFILYGALALVLGIGDAFHLVPRVVRVFKGPGEKVNYFLGLGLQVSSVTMTAFYVLLMYIWKCTFPKYELPLAIAIIVWVSALARIVICLLPQNNWCDGNTNIKMSILRNGIFAITGICLMILYFITGNANDYHMGRMVVAIAISFGCYMPVVFYAHKKPMLGMLMIPKTCAYIWMIAMGLGLLW